MCTSFAFQGKHRYFGRNLDLEGSFGEGLVFSPRGLSLSYCAEGENKTELAMLGMGIVGEGFPLYFDAFNECGLGMAGLNFPKSAVYLPPKEGKRNVSPAEIAPYVLGKCRTLKEAFGLLSEINVIGVAHGDLPLTPLHWMITDGRESVVAEPAAEGLLLYEDRANVLTNEPPFPMQMNRLNDFLSLTPYEPEARLGKGLLAPYSRGMGSVGLPGDLSSASRFARAYFFLSNLVAGEGERDELVACFRMLGGVAMPRGALRLREGVYEETVYSSCCDLDEGLYCYATYSNPALHAVKLDPAEGGTSPRFMPIKRETELFFD